MNASINSLLGPLEAATRSGSWEDAEDIAREISRLARLQRLSELKKIEAALVGKQGYMKLKLPALRIRHGESTQVPPASHSAEPWRRLDFMDAPKTSPEASWSEPWPFG